MSHITKLHALQLSTVAGTQLAPIQPPQNQHHQQQQQQQPVQSIQQVMAETVSDIFLWVLNWVRGLVIEQLGNSMAKGDGGDYSSNPASLKQTVSYD